MTDNNIKNITGAGGGGKGGGGGGATEAANTVKSKTLIRVLEVLSEGEIKGLVDGAKSIYFNNTPLQNTDDSYNFNNVVWDQRFGLPSQTYMEGFPSAQAEYGVQTNVTNSSPAIYTVTGPVVDAARCTLIFPSGLTEQDPTNGNLNGSAVSVAFDVKLEPSGVWQTVRTAEIKEKTTSAYEIAFRIERPVGTGAWSLRVRRITPDPATSNIRNTFQLSRVVEIQDVKLEYPETAYVGIVVDAESVGSSVPKRAYLVDGIKCKIPTNYNPYTATYTGIWNGQFKVDWTDNPAWILYDLLTNTRYGMGEFVKEEEVDKYSFYDAAVYNDELVPDGKGGQERRFTFNTVIASQEDAVKVIQSVAGSFRATLLKEGSLFRLNQDRPSDPVRLITKSNVIDGKFTYQSTALQERHTVARVTYNDKNDRYLRATTTYEGTQAQIDRYGWNVAEANAYGATTEGQALRFAKWLVDTEMSSLDMVTWSSSFNQMDLRVGDVVKVYDEDYVGVAGSGRILNAELLEDSRIKITLDRDIEFTQQIATIQWNRADGEIAEASFVPAVGSANVVILDSSVPVQPQAMQDFVITQAVQPRLFRVMTVKYGDQPNIVVITALQYDPNKYSRVEQGLDVPAPVYTAVNLNQLPEVTNISFRVASKVTDEGIRRSLLVSWTPPYSTILSHYTVFWKKDKGSSNVISRVFGASAEIENITDATYEVTIIAHTITGTQSNGATASYVYSLVGGSGSTLLQPTALQVAGTNSDTFSSTSLEVEWTNPAGNANVTDATLKDFIVSVRDTSDSLIRVDYVDAVSPGLTQKYLYSFERNKADGGPRRQLKISVAARDTDNKFTSATTVLFENPLPSAPTIEVKAGVKSLMIETSRPTAEDYAGTIIWASTTPNFAIVDTNKVYQGPNTFYILENVTGTYYFKAAHYDSFGTAGAALSSEGSGTPSSAAGITTVTSLPANPSAVGGQQAIYLDVANTSTRGLYAWNGTSWAYTRDGANLIANSVTADKLTVANLAAISANMGNVTAGTLTLDQTGYVRGGATAFSAGTGFWQGYDGGAYKWRVGTPGSSRAEWNGTSFNIYDASGNLTISSGVVDYTKLNNKPTSLSAISSTEATKLAGIAPGATNVTNTNQLTDGAALGQTALWASVSGSGKPENNATVGANSSNLNVGLGVNLLPNTEWLNNNIAPCVMGWNVSSCDLWSGASNTPDWVPTGGNALVIYQGARTGNQWNIGADIYPTGAYAAAATGIPVVAGKRYELSAKLAAHRCTVMIAVDFFDTANAHQGGFSTGLITVGTGGKQLSNWTQGVCFGIAPANAAYASIYFRKSDTDSGQASSYAWFTQPHFGLATDAQTVASAYTPGTSYAALTANWSNVSGSGKPQDNATYGATIGTNLYGQITSANASTYIANAAIGSAQIGSVALVGTNSFSVKTATSGERIEMNGQVIKVFDANNVCRVQIGNLSV